MLKSITRAAVLSLGIAHMSINAGAQANPELPDVTTQDLGGGIYMLKGRGGNVGVSVGTDGIIVIDDQFANMAPKLLAAIRAVSDQDIRFLINTHYHGDHTGGNVIFNEQGATIIAHDNVHTRLSTARETARGKVEAKPKKAWPTLTFGETARFHMNGDLAQLVHLPNAHTDGDALIYFKNANVLHMGDAFFNKRYPYIDVASGGSINGAIAAHDLALSMIDANTKIIPGHGALASQADLKSVRDTLFTIRARIQKHIDAGDSKEQMLAANATELYPDWGDKDTQDWFFGIVYQSLTGT